MFKVVIAVPNPNIFISLSEVDNIIITKKQKHI